MIIGIDFDGTCVTHDFPRIGREIGATEVLRELVAQGHRLILFTMRSDINNPQSKDYNINKTGGRYLSEAVEWVKERDIPLFGINENPQQKSWTHSPKPYCHLYIDDASLGIPLESEDGEIRQFVDWVAVKELLIEYGVLDIDKCFTSNNQ